MERHSFQISTEFAQWLRRAADSNGVTRSQFLRSAISEWIEDHRHELPPDIGQGFKDWKDRD